MLDNHDINRGAYDWAVSQGLRLKPGELYTRIREPYFFSYVRDQLIDKYGANTVRSGGLKVYTTIVPRYQAAAVKAIRDTLYYRTDPASALVAIDPATGAIKAMTGVIPGKAKNEFNLAAQARRQAGSTFKTFVLTTAVSQGIDPSSATFVSAPFHYEPNSSIPAWDVSTYDHSYSGDITVEDATLRSDNTVYAQLTIQVGAQNVANMAHKLGVRTPLPPVPSIGLGSIAVSPLEMASAYATLAAGGIYSKPMAIRRVVLPNGESDSRLGQAGAHASDPGRGRRGGDPHPGREHHQRDGSRRLLRPTVGGQDGHDREQRGRLVLRVHADARDLGLDRLRERRDPDARRARDHRLGPDLPDADLEAVHGIGDRQYAGGRLPGPARSRRCGSRSPAARTRSSSRRLRPRRRRRPSPKPKPGHRRRRRPRRRPRDRRLRLRLLPRLSPRPPPPVEPPPPPPPPAAAPAAASAPAAALSRAAAAAGALTLALVAVCAAVAWPGDSPVAAQKGGTTAGDTTWSWIFLGCLIGAFAAYVGGVYLIRRFGLRLVVVAVLAAAIQLAPLGAPLLLSTDAWTYWDYGRIAAVHDANPYVQTPSDFPNDPAFPYVGEKWVDTTSVYGPAFTLASEPLALADGESADAAAWTYKTLAAVAAARGGRARRVPRARPPRVRLRVRRVESAARPAFRGRRAQRRLDGRLRHGCARSRRDGAAAVGGSRPGSPRC